MQVRYRIWRAATGIVAEAEDAERGPGEGYHFKVIGQHDSRVDHLLEALRARIRRSLSHPSLEPHPTAGVGSPGATPWKAAWSGTSPGFPTTSWSTGAD